MDESGRRAPGDGGGIGDPVQVDGIGDSPLRADEHATYRTDPTAGDGSSDAERVPLVGETRTWFAVGLFLFLVFLGILAWAVLQPLFV